MTGNARIVLHHIRGRRWAAWTEGQRADTHWERALAALAQHANTITGTHAPTYHLDADNVRTLARECVALGIPLTGGMKAP